MKPVQFPLTKDEVLEMVAGEKKKMRASNIWAAYSRKSRLDPHNPGYSMDIQPDQTVEYAYAYGAKEVILFEDPGRSGRNSNRRGFQSLIYAIKAKQVDVVVIHRLDRIFRNLMSLLMFVKLLKDHHVRLVSVTEHIDTDTWWGRLVFVVLGSLAEAYLWQTSERTREGLDARRQDGYHVGLLPLGYCNGLCSTCTDENGLGYCPLHGGPDRVESQRGKLGVPHPVDRHVIVKIYQWYMEGMSLREIAVLLNNHLFTLPDGLKALFRPRHKNAHRKDAKQSGFNREGIRAILENPFYAGQIARYRRPKFSLEDDIEHPEKIPTPKIEGDSREILEMHPGRHEPLITYETWKLAQAVRKGKASTPATKHHTVRVYPLSGVARCWECFEASGQEFTLRGSTSGNGTRYYRCAYAHDQALKRKPKKSPRIEGINPLVHSVDQKLLGVHKLLPFKKVEDQVDQLMARLVIPPEWYDTIAAYYLSGDGLAEFERAGYQHRLELQQLKDLYLAGHVSGPEFERRTRLLQTNLNSLKPAFKPEAQPIIERVRVFADFWRALSNQRKRILLDTVFAGLYFNREGELIRAVAYEPFDKLLQLPADGLIGSL